jgi:hypothetical protein
VVRTDTGRPLYPKLFTGSHYPTDWNSFSAGQPFEEGSLEPLEIGRENLRIMEEGIVLAVAVEIPRNSLLGNSILVFYIFAFSFILFWTYRVRSREAERLNLLREEQLEAASGELKAAQERLTALADSEKRYQQDMEKLRAEAAAATERARTTEDEALTEIEALEQKLQESTALREEMEEEVLRLSEEVEQLETAQRISPKKKAKQIDNTAKRFRTLYKHLEFDTRALEGFLKLQSDFQLKGEELIHNMNEDISRLQVKRKIFAGKGALPVFETEFAYKGRLYWKKREGGKTQVLCIGTKNSQAKDLAYLRSLEERK